jgi:hypothetical protein
VQLIVIERHFTRGGRAGGQDRRELLLDPPAGSATAGLDRVGLAYALGALTTTTDGGSEEGADAGAYEREKDQ